MNGGVQSNPIKSLFLKNFTDFSEVTMNFRNLNVLIGENGLGKTHLLKVLYAIMHAGRKSTSSLHDDACPGPTKKELGPRLTGKLVGVFRPKGNVGRLVRRRQGTNKCVVKMELADRRKSIGFEFGTRMSEVNIVQHPAEWHTATPVFLPTHELLSIYPGFRWMYENFQVSFDETWYDTCALLGAPAPRGRRKDLISPLLNKIENVLGGSIIFDNTRFYLRSGGANTEMPLVAEGLSKVGMLSHLLKTGQLPGTGWLFWDEPESNLNPKIIKTVAETIHEINRSGTQVFVATHSMFLLKELEILRGDEKNTRYFALEKDTDGTVVHPADNIYDVEPLLALDVENDQSVRFVGRFH